MLLAGETLNIFLLTAVSNINIFFIKKKNNVVVYSNIHDLFALWSPQCWSLPHMENWQKLFLWWGLPYTSLLSLLMLLVGLNFLPHPLQAAHGHCAAIFYAGSAFAKTWKLCHRHNRGEPSLSLVICTPTLITSSNNMISLTNLPLTLAGPGVSRWAPLFMCSLKLILVLRWCSRWKS